VTGLQGGGIRLWDAADLVPVGPALRPTGGEVSSLAFDRDGGTLSAITSDGTATIWDFRARSLLRGPWVASHGYGFGGVSPDGRTLAACGADGVTLWDVTTGARVGQLGADAPGDCGFSHTGELYAVARNSASGLNPGSVEIWDVAQRRRISTIHADKWGAFTVGFSPIDDTLATAGWESMVRIWNARTGELTGSIDRRGFSGVAGIQQTVFSPDGQTLAIGGGKGDVTLFDLATGARFGTLDGSVPGKPGARLWMTTDLASDGKRLLMTLGDGRAIVWDIDPDSWAQRACEIGGRTLTRLEWDEFLPGLPYDPACSAP
jgi:WD40 repeat protein